MKRGIWAIMFLILFTQLSYSQKDTIIQWLTFEQAGTAFQKKQKPILIFATQPGDTISKKMLNTTFSLGEIANYINVLFYPVMFDITTQDTITFFNGEKFPHIKGQKYHSLAKTLLDSIATPALVVFGKNAQGRVFYGYKDRDTLFSILIYYAEDVYMTHNFVTWQKYYFKAYPPGKKQIISKLYIHWMTMDEMLEKQKTQPRKVLIDIYNNYNVAQTVMRLTVYNNPELADYINRNFYPVTLPLRSEEEFEFKGIKFKNRGEPTHYHEFAVSALSGKMKFPAFVILDENLNIIERVQSFVTIEEMKPLLHFYAEDAYKKEKFSEYLKNWKKSESQTN